MTLRECAPAGVLVAAALLLAACATDVADSEEGSGACYGPWLDREAVAEPPDGSDADAVATVGPGETLTVYGHGYTSTCNDTGERRDEQPLRSVRLTVTLPNGGTVDLGEFTPRVGDGEVGFVATVAIPPGVSSGTAVVKDDLSPTARFTFAVWGPSGAGSAG